MRVFLSLPHSAAAAAALHHTDVKEVFDLFDFWDGRDGMVDGAKIGDFLRCCNLNPTNAIVLANGGVENMGSCRLLLLMPTLPLLLLPLQSLNCWLATPV